MMKRVIALILSLTMCLGLMACTSSNSDASTPSAPPAVEIKPDNSAVPGEEHETFKIAICEAALTDESVIRSNYFKNYIAPAYNCEFIFSEACGTTEAVMTFIENASDAGCVALINYLPMDSEQLTQLCREKGMLYVENGNRNGHSESTFTGSYDNFAGMFAADQQATGKLFYDYMTENLSADETHGFLVSTGGAYLGNEQQYQISVNMLAAIQEVYGLTFENTIEELVEASSPIEAKNDKGVEIYVYPGMSNADGWLQGLSAALQTGKYDYCLFATQGFIDAAVTIEEIEASYKKDVTVVSFATFGDSLTNAFNTKDAFGNSSINMGTVKFTSLVSAMAFVEIYNTLTGYQACLADSKGEMPMLGFAMQAVTSAEQLEEMSSWDNDGKWVGDYDLINSCLGMYHKDLTPEQIQANFSAVTYETIRARLG